MVRDSKKKYDNKLPSQVFEHIAEVTANLDRKEAEEALRQSEEKYRTLINSMDEGYCMIEVILDKDGKPVDELLLEMNPAYEKHTGLTRDIVGKRTSEIVPGREKEWLDFFGNVALTGKPGYMEYHVDPIGRWLATHASRVGGEGSLKVAMVFTDITERKRREERQQYLLKLSDALRPLNDPVEIEGVACRLLAEEIKADRVYFVEINELAGHFRVRQDYHRDNVSSVAGLHAISAYAWAMPLYRRGERVVIPNIYVGDLVPLADLKAMEKVQIVSCFVSPLIKNKTLVGLLAATQSVARQWTTAEIELIEETQERTWAVMERARSEEASRKSE
jgi:PAS domain S-box-containing protein